MKLPYSEHNLPTIFDYITYANLFRFLDKSTKFSKNAPSCIKEKRKLGVVLNLTSRKVSRVKNLRLSKNICRHIKSYGGSKLQIFFLRSNLMRLY